MVLNRNKYNAAYFGDITESDGLRHVAGYSNYLEQIRNSIHKKRIEDFIKKHNIQVRDKVLELGAGIGYYCEIALAKGIEWNCLDVSQWCYDHAKLETQSRFILQDAVTYLPTLVDNSYDYIVSFGFIECFEDSIIRTIIPILNRVAIKQIHSFYKKEPNQYYNIKSLTEWKSFAWKTGTVLELVSKSNEQVIV